MILYCHRKINICFKSLLIISKQFHKKCMTINDFYNAQTFLLTLQNFETRVCSYICKAIFENDVNTRINRPDLTTKKVCFGRRTFPRALF